MWDFFGWNCADDDDTMIHASRLHLFFEPPEKYPK